MAVRILSLQNPVGDRRIHAASTIDPNAMRTAFNEAVVIDVAHGAAGPQTTCPFELIVTDPIP